MALVPYAAPGFLELAAEGVGVARSLADYSNEFTPEKVFKHGKRAYQAVRKFISEEQGLGDGMARRRVKRVSKKSYKKKSFRGSKKIKTTPTISQYHEQKQTYRRHKAPKSVKRRAKKR